MRVSQRCGVIRGTGALLLVVMGLSCNRSRVPSGISVISEEGKLFPVCSESPEPMAFDAAAMDALDVVLRALSDGGALARAIGATGAKLVVVEIEPDRGGSHVLRDELEMQLHERFPDFEFAFSSEEAKGELSETSPVSLHVAYMGVGQKPERHWAYFVTVERRGSKLDAYYVCTTRSPRGYVIYYTLEVESSP